jgi:hypothetical protein
VECGVKSVAFFLSLAAVEGVASESGSGKGESEKGGYR